jgi:uncharacterized protein (DUF849 family)
MSKRILTCAVTGGAPVTGRNPAVPVTPQQIAASAIAAAKAGAAVLHLHVRDPATGAGSMDLAHWRELVARIRDSGTDAIINLSTGDGAMFAPSKDNPGVAGPGSNMCSAMKRVEHVLDLKPEMCSLDFNTMWFRTRTFINSPEMISEMAGLIYSAGALPEFECFDSGDIHLARKLLDDGVLKGPGFFQLVLGVNYGAAATPQTLVHASSLVPNGAKWAAFGVGSAEYPMLAQSLLLGGHVRVGLEDNLYLKRGVLAPSNAALVAKAVDLMEHFGIEPATPDEARELLALRDAAVPVRSVS